MIENLPTGTVLDGCLQLLSTTVDDLITETILPVHEGDE